MHHRCTTCFDSRLALPILQAPPPTRATERRWGVYTSEKSAKIHLSQEALEAWRAEHGVAAKPAETDPTYTASCLQPLMRSTTRTWQPFWPWMARVSCFQPDRCPMSDLTLCVSVWLESPRRDGSVEVRIVHFRLEIASLEAKGAHHKRRAPRGAHTNEISLKRPT